MDEFHLDGQFHPESTRRRVRSPRKCAFATRNSCERILHSAFDRLNIYRDQHPVELFRDRQAMSRLLWLISPALYLKRHQIADNQSQPERVNVGRLDFQLLFARVTNSSKMMEHGKASLTNF
ncbi:MAG: hypothetical protein ABSE90_09225 [Verrucomicrobiota bacterium]